MPAAAPTTLGSTTCHGAPAAPAGRGPGADDAEQPDADGADDEAVAQGEDAHRRRRRWRGTRRCRRAAPTLSFVPNVSIANSLTNGGAASIRRSPTSSTGERQARFSPARSSATPRAIAGDHEPGEDREDPRRPAAFAAAVARAPPTGRRRRRGQRVGWCSPRWFAAAGGSDGCVRDRQVRRSRSTARSMTSRVSSPVPSSLPRRRSVGAIVTPSSYRSTRRGST